MSTKYDVLVDRLAGTPRAASAAAGELERQTIRDTFAARDAFLDAVPPPGAADRGYCKSPFCVAGRWCSWVRR